MIKNHFQKNKTTLQNRGFALLFAILASSVLLSVSIAIWNIAFREVVLSSFGRESQSAFYIADSATECAFYWDFAFARTGKNSFPASNTIPGASTLLCGGKTVQIITDSADSLNASSHFTIDFNGGRATVYIAKTNLNASGFSLTNVLSHGQNSINSYEPTLVERGLKANY